MWKKLTSDQKAPAGRAITPDPQAGRKVVTVQREVVRRNVVNYRIKKKDTGEASFIYWNKNKR